MARLQSEVLTCDLLHMQKNPANVIESLSQLFCLDKCSFLIPLHGDTEPVINALLSHEHAWVRPITDSTWAHLYLLIGNHLFSPSTFQTWIFESVTERKRSKPRSSDVHSNTPQHQNSVSHDQTSRNVEVVDGTPNLHRRRSRLFCPRHGRGSIHQKASFCKEEVPVGSLPLLMASYPAHLLEVS